MSIYPRTPPQAPKPARKKVAAIVTVYTPLSHADVIVGKILEGYDHNGGPGPDLQLVSLFVDQYPEKDMSKALARKHGFAIYDSIEAAVLCGGKTVGVDGVLSIGEHGKYDVNDKGQQLYPRRRFFEGIVKAFEAANKAVPVFNDKHLAATWEDARWMYDAARKLYVPFMAGSSLPVTWRQPELALKLGCVIDEAVAVGYGPQESYGFHMLECLQCMVERRKGGETGVQTVECLAGEQIFKAMDAGRFSKSLLEAALDKMPARAKGDYRQLIGAAKDAYVCLIEYRDGLKAAALMANGLAHEGRSGAFTFAAQLRGEAQPRACHFYLQVEGPFGHFSYLLQAIDKMIQTGHASYPVERTLLTTGILDAAMTSLHEKGKRLETKHLKIEYQPVDWPFAPGPVPPPLPRQQ